MSCSLTAPCGGILHETLRLPDAAILECLNSHTFRVGAPAPAWKPSPFERGPAPQLNLEPKFFTRSKTHLTRTPKDCEHCGTPLEAGRYGSAKMHIHCRVLLSRAKDRTRNAKFKAARRAQKESLTTTGRKG